MMTTIEEKHLVFAIEQYSVDLLLQDGWNEPRMRMSMRFQLDFATQQLRIDHWVAALRTATGKVIARAPATRWNAFLYAIGLDRFVSWRETKLDACMAYPKVVVPAGLKTGSHIRFRTYEEISAPPYDSYRSGS